MFFYGYVYEDYYENNVDRCFTYLSGYADNGTARSSLLAFLLWNRMRYLDVIVRRCDRASSNEL